ncbi:MAG: Maf family protein [Egibacteraceae bacterium]
MVLASGSPRRLELLRAAGLDPLARPPDVDEAPRPGEAPVPYVVRVARDKVRAVPREDGEVVLAADTTVVVDGEPLGKPADAAHAADLLRRLAGSAHHVTTAVAVLDAVGGLTESVVTTEVRMVALDDAAIAAYVATGEPLDKAGAYAIQGRAAALVERIDGSYTNVVGMPLVETLRLLAAAGVVPTSV